jgi:hypothetical protein
MKQAAIVVLFFPLLAFCLAGAIEMRSDKDPMQKFTSLIPIVLGVIAFGLWFGPGWLLQITPESSVTLSRIMTMVSAIIACSGVFVSFSRRTSAMWVASGGLVLAFFWMFNRILA